MATTGGIDGGDIRDLMIESVERRFGLVNRLAVPIEWLADNGSPYTAGETRKLAREPAQRTAFITSAAPIGRQISPGRRAILPFHSWRASS